jgi:hypothetical protein
MPKTFGPGKPFMSLRFAKTCGTGLYFFPASFSYAFLKKSGSVSLASMPKTFRPKVFGMELEG